jgi:hypothetical protein
MIEVAIKSAEWSFDRDPRSRHEGFADPYRRLIANGFARQTRESALDFVRNFETEVRIEAGESEIPQGSAINIIHARTGQRLLATRRYDWGAFLKWLKAQRFEIVSERSFIFPGQTIGMGVAVLRKQTTA